MFAKLLSFSKGRLKKSPGIVGEERMKCCPECGDEFRPDFTRCAICDVELVLADKDASKNLHTDEKRKERDITISPTDKLVTMRRGNLLELKTVQHLLKKEIIGSLLVEDRSNSGSGCCNSKVFELRVKQRDADDARQILIEDFKRSTSFDSHDFDEGAEAVFDQRMTEARCPACGCQFVTNDRTCPECGLCF